LRQTSTGIFKHCCTILSMQELITCIPECISCTILTEFLQVSDVARLDTVFGTSKLARLFRKIAFSDLTTYHMSCYWSEYEAFLKWTIRRGARLDGFHVTTALIEDQVFRRSLFLISGSSVRSMEFLTIRNRYNAELIALFADIAIHCRKLTCVVLAGLPGAPEGLFDAGVSLLTLCESCILLQSIQLFSLAFESITLANILANCSSITKLELSDCRVVKLPVEIAQPTLHVLRLTGALLREDVLKAIAANCQQLHTLEVFKCHGVRDAGLEAVLKSCPKLRHTDVECAITTSQDLRVELARRRGDRCLCPYTWRLMDDNLARKLVLGLPMLEELNCRHCNDYLSVVTVALAVEHCPVLATLDISYYPALDNAIVKQIFMPGNQLKRLLLCECHGVSDTGLAVIAENCPQLEDINLSGANGFSDEGVHVLAMLCAKLKSIELSRCDQLGDGALSAVGTYCSQLESIRLEACDQFTAAGVSALVREGSKLRVLDLNSCPQLGDEAVRAVAEGCSLLEELHCPQQVADASLIEVAMLCPRLAVLGLTGCSQVGDAGITAVAKYCPLLRVLELDNHCTVTLRAISMVVQRCPLLTDLALSEGFVCLELPKLKHSKKKRVRYY
jgi:hypothetical protein